METTGRTTLGLLGVTGGTQGVTVTAAVVTAVDIVLPTVSSLLDVAIVGEETAEGTNDTVP